MTLNDLEWHNSPNFAFFSPNLIALLPNYVTVFEDRLMSVKYCLPFPVSHLAITNPLCSMVSLRQLSYLFIEDITKNILVFFSGLSVYMTVTRYQLSDCFTVPHLPSLSSS